MILSGFKEKLFFRIGMWHSRPPRDPPLMANAILNFHFDYPHPSLIAAHHCFSIKSYSPHYCCHIGGETWGRHSAPQGETTATLWRTKMIRKQTKMIQTTRLGICRDLRKMSNLQWSHTSCWRLDRKTCPLLKRSNIFIVVGTFFVQLLVVESEMKWWKG